MILETSGNAGPVGFLWAAPKEHAVGENEWGIGVESWDRKKVIYLFIYFHLYIYFSVFFKKLYNCSIQFMVENMGTRHTW